VVLWSFTSESDVIAKYVIIGLSVVFIFLAILVRLTRPTQGRIWLLVAVIFAAVGAWLLADGTRATN
jgi:hypothetical protein